MADGTLETTVRQFDNQVKPESIQIRAITYDPEDIIKVDVVGSPGTAGEEISTAILSDFQREPLEWVNSHQTYKLKFYLTAGGNNNSPEVHVASLRADSKSSQIIWNSGGTDWSNATSSDNMAVDGSKVGLASIIPDSGNLQARYDFSEEDGSTPVTDLTGNGYDLSGSYSGVGRDINGVQAGDFDGTDDSLSQSTQISTNPSSVYAIFKTDSYPDSGAVGLVDSSDDSNNKNALVGRTTPDEWSIINGSFINTVAVDTTTAHVFGGIFDGSNSIARFDGSEFTGDTGSRTPDGLSVGNQGSDSGVYFDGLIGEILYYGVKHDSATRSDVETYLAAKWGVTL